MPVKTFFCYAHEDEALLNKLKTHLRSLQRQGLIELWHDRDISAGMEWNQEIIRRLNTAEIISLLISPDFMDSEYCYGIELKRAIERHNQGEARVIPIILRSVDWQGAPFGKLQALPTNAKPIISSSWHNIDEAFLDAVKGIRKVINELLAQPLIPNMSRVGDNPYVPFNEVLERELRKRNWKEEDLAQKLGVLPQDVYRWEKGELEPDNVDIEALCEIFSLSPQEMGLVRDESLDGMWRSKMLIDIDNEEEDEESSDILDTFHKEIRRNMAAENGAVVVIVNSNQIGQEFHLIPNKEDVLQSTNIDWRKVIHPHNARSAVARQHIGGLYAAVFENLFPGDYLIWKGRLGPDISDPDRRRGITVHAGDIEDVIF